MQGVSGTCEAIKQTQSTVDWSGSGDLKISPFSRAHRRLTVCDDECGPFEKLLESFLIIAMGPQPITAVAALMAFACFFPSVSL